MPRNLIVYGLAVIAGLIGYWVLRSLLGGEIMIILALVALVAGGVIMFRNLQTNRKVGEATPEQRMQALSFAPDPSKAALYVFRNQFVGRAVGVNLLIDGRDVAQIKSPRFTRILLSPGAHRVSGFIATNAKPADVAGLELVANPGEIYVAKCEVEAQMIGATVKFTPLQLDVANAELRKITKMIVPDVAEV